MESIMKAVLFGLLLLACGCQQAYPKFLDSPELKTAMVEAIRDSNKTWKAEARASNPELEFFYKISLGARVIGVDGEIGSQGAAGPFGYNADVEKKLAELRELMLTHEMYPDKR
jgi:hypothetical protein